MPVSTTSQEPDRATTVVDLALCTSGDSNGVSRKRRSAST